MPGSFVRWVPCTATNQPTSSLVPFHFPSFFSDSLLLWPLWSVSPQVTPRLTSAQQQQPPKPSPAQPLEETGPPACSASSSASSASPTPSPSPSFEATFFSPSLLLLLFLPLPYHQPELADAVLEARANIKSRSRPAITPNTYLEKGTGISLSDCQSRQGIAADSRHLVDLPACTCPLVGTT